MEINILREKLTAYIQMADEKKIEALYTLLKDDIKSDYKWYEDETFVKESDEDYKKYESGEARTYTMEEMEVAILEQKKSRILTEIPNNQPA